MHKQWIYKVEIIKKNKKAIEVAELPNFESDSDYLDKRIKDEIVPQSIVNFLCKDEIKREESTIDYMPNFKMDYSYLEGN